MSFFKLVSARERTLRDMVKVRCIKYKGGKTLVKDMKIKERWQRHFYRLFNREQFEDCQHNEQRC